MDIQIAYMGKGAKKGKGKKLQLGEFLGDSAGNTVNIDGKTVEMPTAPKAATLEIDASKVRLVLTSEHSNHIQNYSYLRGPHLQQLCQTLHMT